MRWFVYRLFFLPALLFFLPVKSWATHNRAGEITYEWLGGLTFRFTITTYTNPTSPADRDALVINYGDCPPYACDTCNCIDTIPRTSIVTILPGVVQKNTYVGVHTYSAYGKYTISMQDPNRVADIVNISGSVNVPFYLETTMDQSAAFELGINNSPVFTNPPIDYATLYQPFIHNPGAVDPDGDVLRYALAVPKQDPNLDVPGYQYPDVYTIGVDTFQINTITGDVTWNVPLATGIYNFDILISEYREGYLVGTVLRDVEIFVKDNNDQVPVIAPINDTCVYAGEELNINVTATDPDLDSITLSAVGGPFILDESPAVFPTVGGGNGFVEGTFSWQTICDHIRAEPYEAIFKATDHHPGTTAFPLVDYQSWLITVIGPPPLGLTAVPGQGFIALSWDSVYTCADADNFLGFSIWRKIGCDSTIYDKCQRGLDGLGYDSIAFLTDAYHYIDSMVVMGQEYAYRIVAEFGNHSPIVPTFIYNRTASAPSDGVCVQLNRDLPVIHNASVRNTSLTNGSMYVAWYNPLPDALDTVLNPPPYRYDLYRYTGILPSGTPDLIYSVTANSFTGLAADTSYIDTLINTQTTGYTYRVQFFSNDFYLGSSAFASSVFLSIAPSDNKLTLSWNFHVPWLNVYYDVYREEPPGSGDFQFLISTTLNTYTDTGLANGSTHCYYVKAYGIYTDATLPDTLINFSQIACGTPVDNEPPCAPTLDVHNICMEEGVTSFDESDLKNTLIWTDPNHSCADDVIAYLVYYTSEQGGQLMLIDSIFDSGDTTFVHENLQSIAGCYAVVALDSFYNASTFSNEVCVDNCADYNLPNTFTPNGDGFNDLFTPILPYRFIDHIEMKIFDRWGNLVFETEDPMINWDGKNLQGKDVAEGVYYYVCNVYEITVSGVKPFAKPKKGYIHLIRADLNK